MLTNFSFFSKKKGVVNTISFTIALVVIGITLGVGAVSLQKMKSVASTDTALSIDNDAENITESSIVAIKDVADFQSIIAIILVGAIILGLVGLIIVVRS
jgi:hypothetical protein